MTKYFLSCVTHSISIYVSQNKKTNKKVIKIRRKAAVMIIISGKQKRNAKLFILK
jgi:hypothetical protein